MVVSVLGSLLLVEGAMRAFDVRPIPFENSRHRKSIRPLAPPRDYGFVPGYSGEIAETPIAINSLGFRGPEPTDPAPATRIVVLGDSVAFGLFVSEEETFARQLQHKLAAANRVAEVSNVSVPGYDTHQEVAFLEELYPRLRPQHVVLQVCLNDVSVASPLLGLTMVSQLYSGALISRSRLLQWLTTQYYRRRIEQFNDWSNDAEVFLANHRNFVSPIPSSDSELLARMARVREAFPVGENPPAWFGDPVRVGWLRHAFEQLAKRRERHGFRVTVLLVPLFEEFEGKYPFGLVHPVVEHEARRLGFGFLDVTRELEPRGMKKMRAREFDNVHPSAEAHALIAAALAQGAWLK